MARAGSVWFGPDMSIHARKTVTCCDTQAEVTDGAAVKGREEALAIGSCGVKTDVDLQRTTAGY